MHLVDFHMWDSPTNHVLIVLLIPVKEVGGVNTHTNCSLQKHIQVLMLCAVLYNIPKVPKSLYVQCETPYLTYFWVGPLLKPSLLSLFLKTLILVSDLCRGSFSFHHLGYEDMT